MAFQARTPKGCHFHLQEIFPPRDRTCVSCAPATADGSPPEPALSFSCGRQRDLMNPSCGLCQSEPRLPRPCPPWARRPGSSTAAVCLAGRRGALFPGGLARPGPSPKTGPSPDCLSSRLDHPPGPAQPLLCAQAPGQVALPGWRRLMGCSLHQGLDLATRGCTCSTAAAHLFSSVCVLLGQRHTERVKASPQKVCAA